VLAAVGILWLIVGLQTVPLAASENFGCQKPASDNVILIIDPEFDFLFLNFDFLL